MSSDIVNLKENPMDRKSRIVEANAATTMHQLEDNSVQLIITDPPFGTNTTRTLNSNGVSYVDPGVDEVVSMVEDVLVELDRVLTNTGLACICLDYRAVHSVAIMAQEHAKLFGEIIWHFESGSAAKKWWSNKHNTILLLSPRSSPLFNSDEVPTVPRKAPKPGYPKTKPVTSVWNINMSTTDPQRVGYPNQKPLKLYERLIRVHSKPGDLVVDPFAGSGTIIEACLLNNRRFVAGDNSELSVEKMSARQERIEAKLRNL